MQLELSSETLYYYHREENYEESLPLTIAWEECNTTLIPSQYEYDLLIFRNKITMKVYNLYQKWTDTYFQVKRNGKLWLTLPNNHQTEIEEINKKVANEEKKFYQLIQSIELIRDRNLELFIQYSGYCDPEIVKKEHLYAKKLYGLYQEKERELIEIHEKGLCVCPGRIQIALKTLYRKTFVEIQKFKFSVINEYYKYFREKYSFISEQGSLNEVGMCERKELQVEVEKYLYLAWRVTYLEQVISLLKETEQNLLTLEKEISYIKKTILYSPIVEVPTGKEEQHLDEAEFNNQLNLKKKSVDELMSRLKQNRTDYPEVAQHISMNTDLISYVHYESQMPALKEENEKRISNIKIIINRIKKKVSSNVTFYIGLEMKSFKQKKFNVSLICYNELEKHLLILLEKF